MIFACVNANDVRVEQKLTALGLSDVGHLASSLRIPAEILAQFARGFSSTSAPSIFSNVPQSNIVSVMNSTPRDPLAAP